MLHAMRVLARLKRLRGTMLDPFRNRPERRLERRLRAQYERDIEALLPRLCKANHALAVQIAALPDTVRGYGHVKERNAERAGREREALLRRIEATAREREAA
ncbi:MAG: hypothetical protein IT514_05410 [Burkholderiales bacterium]|nr:hypothetical protein [Burkholderiales bacterium]